MDAIKFSGIVTFVMQLPGLLGEAEDMLSQGALACHELRLTFQLCQLVGRQVFLEEGF